jgi:hypothetical protein
MVDVDFEIIRGGGMDSLCSPFGRLRRLSALRASDEQPTRVLLEIEVVVSIHSY